jgi:hypothetical protein
MRILTLLIFCISTLVAEAQITISSGDMPSGGQIYFVATAPITAITTTQLANTGANKTWSFNLSPQSTKLDTILAINQTPISYQFAFFGSDFAQKLSQGISFGTQFSLQNIYNFYKNSSTKFELSGFGAELNGFAIPVIYSPKDVIYQFPLSFNNTYSSTSSFSLPIPGIGSWSENRSRSTTVDGWGNLTIPSGTADVLRVHSIIDDVDSFYVEALNQGLKFPRKTHEYKWITKGSSIPLLQVTTNEIFNLQTVTQITYKSAASAVEPDEAFAAAVNMYPVPVYDYLNIAFENMNSASYQVSIYNSFGQLIFAKDCNNNVQIPVQQYPNGVYHIVISNGEQAFARSIQVTH